MSALVRKVLFDNSKKYQDIELGENVEYSYMLENSRGRLAESISASVVAGCKRGDLICFLDTNGVVYINNVQMEREAQELIDRADELISRYNEDRDRYRGIALEKELTTPIPVMQQNTYHQTNNTQPQQPQRTKYQLENMDLNSLQVYRNGQWQYTTLDTIQPGEHVYFNADLKNEKGVVHLDPKHTPTIRGIEYDPISGHVKMWSNSLEIEGQVHEPIKQYSQMIDEQYDPVLENEKIHLAEKIVNSGKSYEHIDPTYFTYIAAGYPSEPNMNIMRLDGVQIGMNMKLAKKEEELMDPNKGIYLSDVKAISNICGGTFIETKDCIFGTTDISQHIEQMENIIEQQMNQEIE